MLHPLNIAFVICINVVSSQSSLSCKQHNPLFNYCSLIKYNIKFENITTIPGLTTLCILFAFFTRNCQILYTIHAACIKIKQPPILADMARVCVMQRDCKQPHIDVQSSLNCEFPVQLTPLVCLLQGYHIHLQSYYPITLLPPGTFWRMWAESFRAQYMMAANIRLKIITLQTCSTVQPIIQVNQNVYFLCLKTVNHSKNIKDQVILQSSYCLSC